MNAANGACEIFHGGLAPVDPAANTAFHQLLLDELAAEVGRQDWPGVCFTHYSRSRGFVSIAITAGDGALSLAALREFRERQAGEEEAGESAAREGRAA
jgi:hypothetical protein